MSRASILPPHYRKNSFYVTTFRNVLLYWLSNLLIFPAYFICVFQFLQESWLPTGTFLEALQSVNWFEWVIFSLPVVAAVFAPRHYHTQTLGREALIFVSAYIIVQTYYSTSEPSLFNYILVFWTITVIFLIFNSWRLYPYLLIFGFVLSMLWVFIPAHATTYFIILCLSIWICASLFIILFVATRRPYPSAHQRRYTAVPRTAYFIAVGVIIIIHAFFASDTQLTGLIGLILLFIAADPPRFLSRQQAYWHYHTRHLHYDTLQARNSPLVGLTQRLNRVVRIWIPGVISLDNRQLYLVLALIVGGIVIPGYVALTDDTQPTNPLQLMLIGVSSSVVLVAVYLTFWLIRNRSRYIVSQFEVNDAVLIRGSSDIQKSPELYAIANLATYLLVEELQRISVLLKLRQVENVNFSSDGNNAFFVTTGVDQEFVNQMQQVVSVDIPNTGTYNLGRLLMMAIRLFTRIKIAGKVQQRTNGSVELWVQLHYGNNRAVAVDEMLVPENSVSEIDEVLLRPIARRLAMKLFIEMGQVAHLGSTIKSLDNLLIGLESSANRNWWRAIAHYRSALHEEETHRQHYGIGHYHLGASLVYQGDWQQGQEHLYIAEQDGPLMAETQYMLAFTLLYLYWSKFHKRTNIFAQVRTRLKTAISLRPDFAEAYQLLGTAYYRRARQLELEQTKGYDKPAKSQTNVHYSYRQAAKYFRKALRLYDHRQVRYLTTPNYYSTAQNQDATFTQQRLTAAHQLGDALRGLGLYTEAESWYRSVHVVYHRNLRNLNDLAKTLILSGNWQHAEEFLLRNVFIHDTAWWDADSCLHMAWALLGGIQSSQGYATGLVDNLARKMYVYRSEDHALQENGMLQLIEAMKYLDFALHQRPRYLTLWYQTDWLTPFNAVIDFLGKTPNQEINVSAAVEDIVAPEAINRTTAVINQLEAVWQKKPDNLSSQVEALLVGCKEDFYEEIKLLPTVDDGINKLQTAIQHIVSHTEALPILVTLDEMIKPKVLHIEAPHQLDRLEHAIQPSTQHTEALAKLVALREALQRKKSHTEILQEWKPLHSAVQKAAPTHETFQTVKDNLHLLRTTGERLTEQAKLWIALRIDSYEIAEKHLAGTEKPKSFFSQNSQFHDWSGLIDDFRTYLSLKMPYGGKIISLYDTLKEQRHIVARYLDTVTESPRATGLVLTYIRLNLAQNLYHEWQNMDEIYQDIKARFKNCQSTVHNYEQPRFIDRWLVDLYAEMTMLTARMLAESNAYELLLHVALAGCEFMDNWMNWWPEKYRITGEQAGKTQESHWVFSPRISRYHHASFFAWKAYALFQCATDETTRSRCQNDDILKVTLNISPQEVRFTETETTVEMVGRNTYNLIRQFIPKHQQKSGSEQKDESVKLKELLDLLQIDITTARKHIYFHPLSMYTQALIYQESGLYAQALEEYEGLLDLIAPYDPKRLVGKGRSPIGDYEPDRDVAETSLRTRMYYMERVCGRQQFYGIINEPSIHTNLADLYRRMGEPTLRTQHLLEAVRQSTYDDLDIDNFLRLANQLSNVERYSEAKAVIEAVRYPTQRLGRKQLSETKRQAPDVLLTTILTRARQYPEAMLLVRRIAVGFTLDVQPPRSVDGLAEDRLWQLLDAIPVHQRAFIKHFKAAAEIIQTYHDHSATKSAYRETLCEMLTAFYLNEVWDRQHSLVYKAHPKDLSSFLDWFIKLPDVRFEHTEPSKDDLLHIFRSERKLDEEVFDWNKLNSAAIAARISINSTSRKFAFGHLFNTLSSAPAAKLGNPFLAVLLSQMVMYLSQENSHKLTQLAGLGNVLAYTRAETGLHLQHGFEDSAVAVTIMNYLLHAAERRSSVREVFAHQLAQFCDTFGWVRYRHFVAQVADKSFKLQHADGQAPQAPVYQEELLKIAETYIRRGTRYNQKRAILHYHLARIYFTRVEIIWQQYPFIMSDDKLSGSAPYIDTALTQAFRYLRSARELDQYGRLHDKLTWLHNLINTYKVYWEKRQFRGIVGDANADPQTLSSIL